jgi:site-specific DNA-methyltransferase (adenine-specific)
MNTPFFQYKNTILLKGDTFKLLPLLKPNSFHMILADPPYFLSNKGVTKPKGNWDTPISLKDQYTFHKNWIKAAAKLLAPKGTIWITGTHHSIHTQAYILQKEGFQIINEIAWYKKKIPSITKRQLGQSHETILWVKKKGETHYYNHTLAKKRGWDDSLWKISPPKAKETIFGRHSTQKPTELIKRIILLSTKQGQSILDPFAGSATTAVVATHIKRKSTSIEKEEKYLQISKKRIIRLGTQSS